MSTTADPYLHAPTGRFVVLTCNVEPANDIQGYVAFCPALGVASQGETLDVAESNIREAVCMYLTAIDEDGDLDRIFAEKGLKVSKFDESSALRARTVDGGIVLADLFPIATAA